MMIDNGLLYIGEKEEIDEVLRMLDFSNVSDDIKEVESRYHKLSDEKKLYIQKVIHMLTGGDCFGYNFSSINNWFLQSDVKRFNAKSSKLENSKLKQYEVAKVLYQGNSNKVQSYLDKIKSLKKTNHTKSEEVKEVIKTYCDNFMISPDLLYIGEGEIYEVDPNEFYTDDYRRFSKDISSKKFNTTLEMIRGYKSFLEKKYPHFKARTDIIKTKYVKIKYDGSYLMLVNTESYADILNYINCLITNDIESILNFDDTFLKTLSTTKKEAH